MLYEAMWDTACEQAERLKLGGGRQIYGLGAAGRKNYQLPCRSLGQDKSCSSDLETGQMGGAVEAPVLHTTVMTAAEMMLCV